MRSSKPFRVREKFESAGVVTALAPVTSLVCSPRIRL
jgi:hypothetical protein